jgi:hypothetical protein
MSGITKTTKNMTDPEEQLEKALHPAFEAIYEQECPNPTREGCPDHSLLVKAATAPGSLSGDENALFLDHVLRKCWPCFQEVKNLRASQKDLKSIREVRSKKPQD